jgi:hypothetical protein
MQHTLEWAVPAMILAGFTEEERCNALVDASINVLGILPLEETDMTSSACMPSSLSFFMFALGAMTLV